MRATLLGFTVPEEMIVEINHADAFLATQTHRFAWGIVAGLRAAGVSLDLLSAAPVSDYPRNPKRIFGFGHFTEHGVEGILLPFVNILGLKHITRWLSAWWIGGRQLRRTEPDWLLVHGVHSPFLWFAVHAKRRVGVRVAVFLTDPPGVVLPSDTGLRRKLKAFDVNITRKALSKVDAVVTLTEPLADDFAPGIPSMTMEGILDIRRWPRLASSEESPRDDFTITYAGGLTEEYGVGLLVRAVQSLDNPRIRLQLLGRGALEPWILEQADRDPRIVPPRLVDPSNLSRIYSSSDLLVQPRPVDQDFVRYSFPSKLMEYMASGVAVLSTKLPGIPDAYHPMLRWCDDSEAAMSVAIGEMIEMPIAERAEYGNRAATFVRQQRSATAQGARLVEFLELRGAAGLLNLPATKSHLSLWRNLKLRLVGPP